MRFGVSIEARQGKARTTVNDEVTAINAVAAVERVIAENGIIATNIVEVSVERYDDDD